MPATTKRFAALRAKTLYFQFREVKASSTRGTPPTDAYKDISAAGLSAKFRAWRSPPGVAATLLLNVSLSKTTAPDGTSETTGQTGWVTGTITFAAAYGQVVCEVVLIDSATADATTPSGYREHLWEDQWTAEVVGSPGA